ncbi:MAG: hypothetical protein ACK56F_05270, partial [bacterium]
GRGGTHARDLAGRDLEQHAVLLADAFARLPDGEVVLHREADRGREVEGFGHRDRLGRGKRGAKGEGEQEETGHGFHGLTGRRGSRVLGRLPRAPRAGGRRSDP